MSRGELRKSCILENVMALEPRPTSYAVVGINICTSKPPADFAGKPCHSPVRVGRGLAPSGHDSHLVT
jgi:hypothetical protein